MAEAPERVRGPRQRGVGTRAAAVCGRAAAGARGWRAAAPGARRCARRTAPRRSPRRAAPRRGAARRPPNPPPPPARAPQAGAPRLADAYELADAPLGSGAFATTRLAVHRATGARRACKSVGKARLAEALRVRAGAGGGGGCRDACEAEALRCLKGERRAAQAPPAGSDARAACARRMRAGARTVRPAPRSLARADPPQPLTPQATPT
jgi:hypothetical protein